MARIASFKVSGKGTFPVDMLRYDMCWPRNSSDANSILTPADRAERAAPREVHLETARKVDPTFARWASFGWVVVACFDDQGHPVGFISSATK
jgi:hypothetical protein